MGSPEKNHGNWKGTEAGYFAKHRWLIRKFGSPRICEHCGRTDRKKYTWANIDGKYSRDRKDYMRLCVSCHNLYDIEIKGKKISGVYFRKDRNKWKAVIKRDSKTKYIGLFNTFLEAVDARRKAELKYSNQLT